jgi:predicted dehydrogenase
MMKRVLVVGTGSIGLRHLRLFGELENTQVEVFDSRPEGLAEALRVKPNARVWSSYDQALESKPNIVVIATPPSSHAPLTCLALQSGAHVFCEKPMADTLEASRLMRQAQQETGRFLNIGFVQRFMPDLLRVRELIQEGVIGTVCYARFSVATLSTLEFSRSRHQQDVFGAAALDYVYGFDTFWWILREQPLGVYARGIEVKNLPLTSNPNVVSAVLDYESDRIAEIHIDYVALPERCSYTFQGDLGFLHLDCSNQTLQIGNRLTRKVSTEAWPYDTDEVMRAQRDHFLEAVGGRQEVSSPALDALKSSAALDGLIRSLSSRQREIVTD